MHHSPPQMLNSYLIKGERPSLLLHVFYELRLWHIVNQSGSAKETVSLKIGKNIEMLALPCPDVFWYHLNGMGTQKKAPKQVCITLFPYIFHIKTEWNIVYEYLKTKIFLRDTNILPLMHWTPNIFGYLATTIAGFWVSLKYPIFNFKKTVCPKKHLDAALVSWFYFYGDTRQVFDWYQLLLSNYNEST